jgi:hypothetical protein
LEITIYDKKSEKALKWIKTSSRTPENINYDSSVFLHCSNPLWNETFKVSFIDEISLKNAIMIITAANCSGKGKFEKTEIFGIGVYNFFDSNKNIFKENGIKEISFHKNTFKEINQKAIKEIINEIDKIPNLKNFLNIHTNFVSNLITSDIKLNNFLNFKDEKLNELIDIDGNLNL